MRSAVELRRALIVLCVPALLGAQDTATSPYARAVATWVSLIAAPGHERSATDRIMGPKSGWSRDTIGNLMKRQGEGTPRRVIACGLDEAGYVVSAITDDGYLRVRPGRNARHSALWDQFHEGQRVVVSATNRANPARPRHVPGVFAVRSIQLWRRQEIDTTPASIDNLWIDVGARSRAEVERMGIDVLNPVVRDWPEWSVADYVAGPALTNRAGCAAIAAMAGAGKRSPTGETVYLISVQKSFNWAGLTATLAGLGRVDSLYIVDSELGRTQLAPHVVQPPWPASQTLDIGTLFAIGLPTRFTGTLAESAREGDLAVLHGVIARAAGFNEVPGPSQLSHGWVAAPTVLTQDSLSRFADLIGKLTDIPAPSGHEGRVRTFVQQLLPQWARDAATVDTAGNLILSMGPNRDTAVFVAHMDEIGFVVTDIGREGVVSLRARGTFFPFLWEGQTALLHRPDDVIPPRDGRLGCGAARGGPLRGVFVPRDSGVQREPATMRAWFGLDSAALVAAGVRVGSPLTSFRCSARMGDMRLTTRSIDDRAGVTALLLALEEIDPAKLDHKVIFAWSVREEGGLEGAKALAATLGPSVRRVHAIDAFASSDSPVESKQFAYAPIGQGALVRALDDASGAMPDEIDRLMRLARAARIPLQAGVTNGANDDSELARFGAMSSSLAWPLRYSHSPAEVIDLRDLRSLTRLVAAAAKAPTKATVKPRP